MPKRHGEGIVLFPPLGFTSEASNEKQITLFSKVWGAVLDGVPLVADLVVVVFVHAAPSYSHSLPQISEKWTFNFPQMVSADWREMKSSFQTLSQVDDEML